jgi:indole-3-glycerol phosphate synthase
MSNTNFLENILAHKKQEVETRKKHISEQALIQKIEQANAPLSLAEALSGDGLAVIAEIKKASPSAGVIRVDFDPAQIAKSYMKAGANALSILTDEEYFQGSLEYIEQIRSFVPVPILRKDFIIDPYQILEARAFGADALLLIVAALDQEDLQTLLNTTYESGLEALVEVHSADEMNTAIAVGAKIIGINNRNLETFRIDLATTEKLAPLAPEGTVLVGESGLHTPDDLQRMFRAGVDAVLVGTHFMKHPDPGTALQEFLLAAKEREETRRKKKEENMYA